MSFAGALHLWPYSRSGMPLEDKTPQRDQAVFVDEIVLDQRLGQFPAAMGEVSAGVFPVATRCLHDPVNGYQLTLASPYVKKL